MVAAAHLVAGAAGAAGVVTSVSLVRARLKGPGAAPMTPV